MAENGLLKFVSLSKEANSNDVKNIVLDHFGDCFFHFNNDNSVYISSNGMLNQLSFSENNIFQKANCLCFINDNKNYVIFYLSVKKCTKEFAKINKFRDTERVVDVGKNEEEIFRDQCLLPIIKGIKSNPVKFNKLKAAITVAVGWMNTEYLTCLIQFAFPNSSNNGDQKMNVAKKQMFVDQGMNDDSDCVILDSEEDNPDEKKPILNVVPPSSNPSMVVDQEINVEAPVSINESQHPDPDEEKPNPNVVPPSSNHSIVVNQEMNVEAQVPINELQEPDLVEEKPNVVPPSSIPPIDVGGANVSFHVQKNGEISTFSDESFETSSASSGSEYSASFSPPRQNTRRKRKRTVRYNSSSSPEPRKKLVMNVANYKFVEYEYGNRKVKKLFIFTSEERNEYYDFCYNGTSLRCSKCTELKNGVYLKVEYDDEGNTIFTWNGAKHICKPLSYALFKMKYPRSVTPVKTQALANVLQQSSASNLPSESVSSSAVCKQSDSIVLPSETAIQNPQHSFTPNLANQSASTTESPVLPSETAVQAAFQPIEIFGPLEVIIRPDSTNVSRQESPSEIPNLESSFNLSSDHSFSNISQISASTFSNTAPHDPNAIFKEPFFKLYKTKVRSEKFKRLFTFDSKDLDSGHEFHFRDKFNYYLCKNSSTGKCNAKAKLLKSNGGEEYVELSCKEHSCEKQEFCERRRIDNFVIETRQRLSGKPHGKLLTFKDPNYDNHEFKYSFNGNKYHCRGCIANEGEYRNAWIRSENGMEYVEVDGKKHLCIKK